MLPAMSTGSDFLAEILVRIAIRRDLIRSFRAPLFIASAPFLR